MSPQVYISFPGAYLRNPHIGTHSRSRVLLGQMMKTHGFSKPALSEAQSQTDDERKIEGLAFWNELCLNTILTQMMKRSMRD